MTRTISMLRLFRPLNLLIMALTLILVRYCIFEPVFRMNNLEGLMPWWQFLLLVLSTVLIGAGGYVINDVLDIRLDQVNKPEKQIIGRQISEVTGKNLHFNLTGAGVILGAIFSYLSGNIFLGILFVIIPTALFYYSLKYKYLPVVGNLVVAVLSALVVLIFWIFEFYYLKERPEAFIDASRYFYQINRLILAFSAFAFLVSLAREVIKDMQDLEGDAQHGCKTLPVVLGIANTRLLVLFIEIVTIAALGWYQGVLFTTGYSYMAYSLFITQALLAYAFFRTATAKQKQAFAHLSLIMKLAMTTGMLAMAAAWFRTF